MFDQELAAEIEEAVAEVREGRRALAERLVATQAFNAGQTPFRLHRGVGAAWNFTLGPAFIYEGPRSIDTLNFLPMPVVVIAKYIPEADLHKIDATRCYGFVFEEGSVIDPAYWWLHDENRASVLGCAGVLADARPDEQVVVDGVRGRVYLGPDVDTLTNYERLRALGSPQKDQVYWDALRRLTTLMIGSRKARKIDPPYNFADQQRLCDITRRARHGEPLSQDDNEWMQGLMLEGMPSPEEMMARAKELEKASKADRKGSKPIFEIGDGGPAGGAGGEGAGAAAGGDADAGSAQGASRRRSPPPAPERPGRAAAAKPSAPAPATPSAPAGADGAPDPFAGLSGAALRRAQRDKEMEEARKRREK